MSKFCHVVIDLRNINKGSHALNNEFYPASTPVSLQRYCSILKPKVQLHRNQHFQLSTFKTKFQHPRWFSSHSSWVSPLPYKASLPPLQIHTRILSWNVSSRSLHMPVLFLEVQAFLMTYKSHYGVATFYEQNGHPGSCGETHGVWSFPPSSPEPLSRYTYSFS